MVIVRDNFGISHLFRIQKMSLCCVMKMNEMVWIRIWINFIVSQVGNLSWSWFSPRFELV